MKSPIALDVFEIIEFLGQGGMAEVWRGRHTLEDVPVAIKFMTGDGPVSSRPAAILEEISTIARLHHRGVVKVFDSGVVGADVEEYTQGRIGEGSAYLVMELASGTLIELGAKRPGWSTQRAVLGQILEALAHSHAMGVIHRDLKPENVLVFDEGDGAVPQVKLTDFGLAYAMEDSERRGDRSPDIYGTPSFMAPEQIEGRWRDQGPWTDLYALGCLAYWLATGRAPFEGLSASEIADAQLHREPSPLGPLATVPVEFQPWLAGLLRKDRTQRYRRAADALQDLMSLEVPQRLGAMADTEAVDDTHEAGTTSWVLDGVRYPGAPAAFVDDWRCETLASPAMALAGAGLGLFGVRSLPLVGRHSERDAIWRRLQNVHQSGGTQALILKGKRGMGMSRIAKWMAFQAHETGAAVVLKASHSPGGGPATGVGRMIADHLVCTGLDRAGLTTRLEELTAEGARLGGLSDYEREGLIELVAPAKDADADDDDGRRGHTLSPRRTRRVVAGVLRELSRRRPVYLMLDDVQWGTDTLELVEYLLESKGDDGPAVLCVMTVEEIDAQEQTRNTQRLDKLEQHSEVDVLAVGPLGDEEHLRLVEQILGLEPALAEQVSHRTAGNPLFAVELVGDWVERDLLEVTADGFALAGDAQVDLPESVHQLLSRRLGQFLGRFDERERDDVGASLKIGAILGHRVDFREWWTACRQAGLSVPETLFETLTTRDLARREPNGWSFAHGALRECLVRAATEEGRFEEYNRHCATMLEDLYGQTRSKVARRRARHWLKGREWEKAVSPLLEAAKYCIQTSRLELAEELFGQYHDTLDRLDVGDDDRGRVEGWLAQLILLGRQERFDDARRLIDRANSVLQDRDWSRLRGELAYVDGFLLNLSGEPAASDERCETARQEYEKAGYRTGLGHTEYLQGLNARWRGKMDKMKGHYKSAYEIFDELDDQENRAKSLIGMADFQSLEGHHDEAIEKIKEAIAIYKDLEDRYSLGVAYSNLGQAYRRQGALRNSRQALETGKEALEEAGLTEITIELNLCCVLLETEAYEEAEAVLEELLPELIDTGREGLLGVVYATFLPCHAAEGDWAQWDEKMVLAGGYLRENSIIDKDLAWTFHLAADLAREAGEIDRARAAYEQARSQWRGLDETEKLDEIEKYLR